jgi:diguanylate cyclase (GGDEF)-like protein
MEEPDPTVAALLLRQDVLTTFGELALRSDSLDEILTEGCRLVREALRTDLAKVMELGGDGMTLLVRAGVGWKDGVLGVVTVQAVKGSSEGFALRTGLPVVSSDIRTESRFQYADFIQDNGVEAIASVIILGAENGVPFGILQVDSRTPRPFDERDTRFLQGYANLIGAAVSRLQVVEKVRHAATHDITTSLPNRGLFRSELELALRHALHAGNPLSLLMIDLDRFKQINDLLGHQAGDAALCAFASRLVGALPSDTMVARLGGDEFVAVLIGTDSADAADQAGRILEAMHEPIRIKGRDVDISASIGISTYPKDGKVSPQLIGNADLALYAAKKNGGGRSRAYEPILRAERQGQLAMLRHARAAFRNGWITPFYQPQITLATGEVRGFEALLRWFHPRAGLQQPATIAYAFDDPSTAGPIGSAMLNAALSDLQAWNATGAHVRKLAINVSAMEFRDRDYADRLLAQLASRGLTADVLEIEITETAFLDPGATSVIAAIDQLRSAGATAALDDFGTGYSSLSHLRDLPVDTIKIDRSFVAGIDTVSSSRSIVEAVLTLGTALGMKTIAEGVETESQAAFLKAHGCTFAQGFFFAPPLPAQQAASHLIANEGRHCPT